LFDKETLDTKISSAGTEVSNHTNTTHYTMKKLVALITLTAFSSMLIGCGEEAPAPAPKKEEPKKEEPKK
jgi:hypothetical protein